jgi:hypothetical protein
MNTPTRSTPHTLPIQSTIDRGEIYQVTLQDGTVLWIPKDADNGDYAQMEAWVEASNITL